MWEGLTSVDRARVTELHYMTTLGNLASIMKYGLLSHTHAARIPHESIASESVQDKRAPKHIPNGRPLHEYVNTYFDARNAMMYDRRSTPNLLVLRIDPAVLDVPGAVISDGNAATGNTAFYASPAGLAYLDEDRVYAVWWTNTDDPWLRREWKRQRQAEVLVPDRIPPEYIWGCYVRYKQMLTPCSQVSATLNVEVGARVFFD